jgi:uncharacterized protein (DUF488 family)
MSFIFTIGHSNRDIKDFLNILANYKINLVVDIRSVPYSAYASVYNQPNLQRILQIYKIEYVFMGDLLGGRPKDLYCYTKDGYWDYEGFINSKKFNDGINRLLSFINDKQIVLMCTEFDPIECHRSLIVGRFLKNRYNFLVNHIVNINEEITQDDLENKLIKSHFPDMNVQYSFFVEEEEVSIEKAYEKQIKEIFKKLKKVVQG